MGNPVGFCFFLFFPGRKGNGSSFLFRRKEIVPLLFFLEEKKQKKIICGTGFPAAPAAFAGLQHKNGRLTYEPAVLFVSSWMCGKPPSVRKAPLSRFVFCFFSSRKEIVPLLFRRKEAKENHLPDLLLRFSLHFAQSCCTKRTAHIRAGRFFCFKLDVRENAFCPKCTPQPLCLLFLFFKKRNRSPSFLFRRKEAKENHLPDLLLRFSLHFAQSCCTKRTAHIRAGRFFCFKLDVRENAFCPKCTPQPLCLLFLFFKKRNRSPSFLFRRKEIVP